jgi:hypothetical protein
MKYMILARVFMLFYSVLRGQKRSNSNSILAMGIRYPFHLLQDTGVQVLVHLSVLDGILGSLLRR